MKNHPRSDDNGDHPEAADEESEVTAPSRTEQDHRLAGFQARCAQMREKTQRELARLAQRRADVRAQVGITSATMEQWKQEHQQMLRDGESQGQ
ncbi:hypothetical protein PF010_g4359 [Phytophthora fragariae]|uniref:Uncharacterized protein n=1 Tax=Phytophthora fragariae TaxID=53985 RepID=A0A6A3MHF2_9STRA|nr:hypothetical protein PF011_g698 [Phytophthora fragariae]KAE9128812.1 hypothetical protein PF010_g4359 [Phytophthora fragariae]KAE9225175.1 hypothetical protein PF004_g11994 [Phytophthora fragariae]